MYFNRGHGTHSFPTEKGWNYFYWFVSPLYLNNRDAGIHKSKTSFVACHSNCDTLEIEIIAMFKINCIFSELLGLEHPDSKQQFGSDIKITNHSYFGIKMCFTVTIICKFVSSILSKILLDAVKDWRKKAENDKLVEICYQNTQDFCYISSHWYWNNLHFLSLKPLGFTINCNWHNKLYSLSLHFLNLHA